MERKDGSLESKINFGKKKFMQFICKFQQLYFN